MLTDLDFLIELALTQFSGEKNGKCLSKEWRNRPTALSWYNEVKNYVLCFWACLSSPVMKYIYTHGIAYKHHTSTSVRVWFAVSYIKCILHFKAKT